MGWVAVGQGHTHLKSDAVAHFGTEGDGHFVGDALRDRHGGHSARLRAPDHAATPRVAGLMEVLRDLRRLARARFAHHNDHLRPSKIRIPQQRGERDIQELAPPTAVGRVLLALLPFLRRHSRAVSDLP